MAVAQSDPYQSGYAVGYGLELGQVRVYGVGAIGVGLLFAAFSMGSLIALVLGLAAICIAVYFFPLIETGRPRIGANQYGIFVEGLGLLAWSGIREVKLVSIAVRTLMTHELQIHLSQPLERVLIADWRKLPWYRQIMHLPWQMSHDNVVRIPLTAFARPALEVHRQFERLFKFYKTR